MIKNRYCLKMNRYCIMFLYLKYYVCIAQYIFDNTFLYFYMQNKDYIHIVNFFNVLI